MPPRLLLATAALLLPIAPGSNAQTASPDLIAGKVVDAASGRPLPHALVSLISLRTEQPATTTFTGDDGSFRFPLAPPPGKYRLNGEAAGHTPGSYLQHDQFSTALVTGVGLPMSQLQLALLPDASIVGHISDEAGEPVAHTSVTLYRQTLDSGKSEVHAYSTTFVEDDGTYRFDHLLPGEYFLSAKGTPWYAVYPPFEPADMPQAFRASVDPALNVAYPTVFYPAAQRSEDALPLALSPGEQVTANLQLSPEPAVALTLTLTPARGNAGQIPPSLTETIFGQEMRVPSAFQITPDAERVPGLAPGRYHLYTYGDSGDRLPSRDAVDLSSGSITRGPSPPTESAVVFLQLRSAAGPLSPKTTVILATTGEAEHRVSATADDKGNVRFEGVPPGEYRLLFTSQQGPLAVDTLEGDAATIHGTHLVVAGTATLHLTVQIFGPSRSVEGFARQNGKPAPAALVLLIPAQATVDPEGIRRDQSDLDGSFTFTNVPPGNYLLLALTDAWTIPWADLHTLAPYLLRAQPVRVPSDAARTPLHLPAPVVPQPLH